MKHLLLATTALVATAGVAAAEVSLSGYAEMGLIGGSDDMETQFHTDIDVTFNMSGESDSGIAFGATIDLDEEGGFSNTNGGPEAVFISYGGATFTMGDTDGAFDKAMSEVNVAGASIADDETAHAGFSGNGGFDVTEVQVGMGLDGTYDGQIARFDYAFEGFTGSISAEMDDSGEMDPVWGLGIAYDAELAGLALGVGLGYQTAEDIGNVMGISLDTTFDNGLMAAINYSQADFDALDDEVTHLALGLGYSAGALAVGVNYGQYSYDGDEWSSGFGLAATYDLGGGLAAHLGYGDSSLSDDAVSTINAAAGEVVTDDSFNTWSLGLSMSF